MAKFLDLSGLEHLWGKVQAAIAAVAYTHPANHPPSIITQDANNRFVTDTEKSTWNGKQNQINTTGILKGIGSGSISEAVAGTDYIAPSEKGSANGVAGLDASGKVPTGQLPALLALGETSTTAYRGDRGKTAYDHSQASGNPHSTTAADVGAVPTSRTVNGKALSANITLNASDVGAESSGAVSTHNSAAGAHSALFGDKQNTISATGILKGAGSGSVSAATAGTDYATPAKDYTANLSTTWSGSSAPFTQNVTISGLASTAKIEVGLASNATAAQYDMAVAAKLHCTAQATNQITVTAFGTKPTATIPIIVRSV